MPPEGPLRRRLKQAIAVAAIDETDLSCVIYLAENLQDLGVAAATVSKYASIPMGKWLSPSALFADTFLFMWSQRYLRLPAPEVPEHEVTTLAQSIALRSPSDIGALPIEDDYIFGRTPTEVVPTPTFVFHVWNKCVDLAMVSFFGATATSASISYLLSKATSELGLCSSRRTAAVLIADRMLCAAMSRSKVVELAVPLIDKFREWQSGMSEAQLQFALPWLKFQVTLEEAARSLRVDEVAMRRHLVAALEKLLEQANVINKMYNVASEIVSINKALSDAQHAREVLVGRRSSLRWIDRMLRRVSHLEETYRVHHAALGEKVCLRREQLEKILSHKIQDVTVEVLEVEEGKVTNLLRDAFGDQHDFLSTCIAADPPSTLVESFVAHYLAQAPFSRAVADAVARLKQFLEGRDLCEDVLRVLTDVRVEHEMSLLQSMIPSGSDLKQTVARCLRMRKLQGAREVFESLLFIVGLMSPEVKADLESFSGPVTDRLLSLSDKESEVVALLQRCRRLFEFARSFVREGQDWEAAATQRVEGIQRTFTGGPQNDTSYGLWNQLRVFFPLVCLPVMTFGSVAEFIGELKRRVAAIQSAHMRVCWEVLLELEASTPTLVEINREQGSVSHSAKIRRVAATMITSRCSYKLEVTATSVVHSIVDAAGELFKRYSGSALKEFIQQATPTNVGAAPPWALCRCGHLRTACR
jgi:hypothetical protein